MNIQKALFLKIVVSFLLSLPAMPQDPEIRTSYVLAQEGESLRELLEYRVGIPSSVLDQQGYYEKIKNWNSKLISSDSLTQNQRIYIEIPFGTVLTPKKREHKMTVVKQAPLQQEKKISIEKNGISRSSIPFQKEVLKRV